MTLSSLFYPRSVLVAGSMTPGKLGAELVKQIQVGGYRGSLYALNPKAAGLGSAEGVSSPADLPEPVDLAVIASPASTVAGVLASCGQAGIPYAIIITSGFSEAGNQAGEQELRRVARQYGIQFVGPNCAGMVNTGCELFPCLELRPPAGSVGFISQSGALGGAVLARAQEEGLGISKFVSYGNGAGLGPADFLAFLAEDAQTRVVGLYIESVPDGRAFMAALETCSRAKPVIVIKAGRTSAGSRATASHTGALAGTDAVYDAAIRQAGALRVRSVDEMLDLCAAFASAPLPGGPRLLIVTNSGGPAVLAADLAEEMGLQVAEPAQGAQARLKSSGLAGHASARNPVDLTVEGTREGFYHSFKALLPDYDAALAINVGTPYLDSLALAQGVVEGSAGLGKPVLASFVPSQLTAEAVNLLKARGIPNYPSGERAVAALAGMLSYRTAREAWRQPQAVPPVDLVDEAVPLPEEALEPQAMAWLHAHGLPTPALRTAQDTDQAAQAANELGFPVVMKVVSPEILHKSEHGGVVLGIRSAEEARQAFERIHGLSGGKDFRGVVIYPQVNGAQEVLIGLSRDAQFGPVVAFGLGGIYTEIWRDVALRVAPVDQSTAMRMILELRSAPLLQGARGQPACDLQALAEMIARVSWLPLKYPDLDELDLNPVFALPAGALVGDVRIIRKKAA